MRKGCFVCGILLAFFGLVLLVFLPVVNWILYPWLERLVILKYTDLKPENTDVWNAWVSEILYTLLYMFAVLMVFWVCP